MIATPTAVNVPLRTDEGGVIRVGPTRVTLITLVNLYKIGQSPEELHEGFPTVPLTDIYAVIAYYLANRDQVDAYIADQERQGEAIRQSIEARTPGRAEALYAKARALHDRKQTEDNL